MFRRCCKSSRNDQVYNLRNFSLYLLRRQLISHRFVTTAGNIKSTTCFLMANLLNLALRVLYLTAHRFLSDEVGNQQLHRVYCGNPHPFQVSRGPPLLGVEFPRVCPACKSMTCTRKSPTCSSLSCVNCNPQLVSRENGVVRERCYYHIPMLFPSAYRKVIAP